jgi:hypothetical protein
MQIRKSILIITCIIITTAFFAGTSAVLAGYGSQEDPLITLSYLTDVYTDKIMGNFDELLKARADLLEETLDSKVEGFEEKLNLYGSQSSYKFEVVSLKSGQSLTGTEGSEFLIREGAAVCVAAAAPGLADITDGSEINNGGSLLINHMYMITADGRGLMASSNVKVIIRGEHTVK